VVTVLVGVVTVLVGVVSVLFLLSHAVVDRGTDREGEATLRDRVSAIEAVNQLQQTEMVDIRAQIAGQCLFIFYIQIHHLLASRLLKYHTNTHFNRKKF